MSSLAELIALRSQKEATILENRRLIEAACAAGFREIDDEGLVTSDVDTLFAVRNARKIIDECSNDLRAINQQLANMVLDQSAFAPEQRRIQPQKQFVPKSLPYYLVFENIAPNSPASESGICSGDAIVTLDSIDIFSAIRDGVHESELMRTVTGRLLSANSIACKVIRDEQFVELTIQPHPWSGRGVLGCAVSVKHW